MFYGLGSCYSDYDNSLNQLPEHVFVAKRGFYYGWMDTNGKWLYCQSIFCLLYTSGTQTYGADDTTALSLSYAPDVLTDWVELDTCHASGEPTDEKMCIRDSS